MVLFGLARVQISPLVAPYAALPRMALGTIFTCLDFVKYLQLVFALFSLRGIVSNSKTIHFGSLLGFWTHSQARHKHD